MDKKEKILALFRQKGEIRTRDVAKVLATSREYAHRLLQELRQEGLVLLVGKTNRAKYVLATDKLATQNARAGIRHISFRFSNVGLDESRVFTRIENETGILHDVPDSVRRLVQFGFTEMLNNAIDHSRSDQIQMDCRRTDTAVTFTVRDFGIGIFNNVRDTHRLPGTLAAIQEILKGKTTTDPERHTGMGVFFTSKSADVFTADSFDKRLTVNNLLPDVFIADRRELKGTRITFSLNVKSPRKLEDVFAAFSGGEDNLEFNKTRITVKLYQFGRDLISRSEAKRVTLNLENFREVELDFADVQTVGQGFADEVFRVWQNQHQNVRLIAVNANENVAFMVKQAGGEIGQSQLGI